MCLAGDSLSIRLLSPQGSNQDSGYKKRALIRPCKSLFSARHILFTIASPSIVEFLWLCLCSSRDIPLPMIVSILHLASKCLDPILGCRHCFWAWTGLPALCYKRLTLAVVDVRRPKNRVSMCFTFLVLSTCTCYTVVTNPSSASPSLSLVRTIVNPLTALRPYLRGGYYNFTSASFTNFNHLVAHPFLSNQSHAR